MREFIEWAAFDRLRGIRIDRELVDVMLSRLTYWTALPNMKNAKTTKPTDFMLWKPKESVMGRSRTPISDAKMKDFISQQMAMGNMKVVKKKRG